MNVNLHVHLHANVHVGVHVHVDVYCMMYNVYCMLYLYMYVYKHMHVHICICIWVCIRIYRLNTCTHLSACRTIDMVLTQAHTHIHVRSSPEARYGLQVTADSLVRALLWRSDIFGNLTWASPLRLESYILGGAFYTSAHKQFPELVWPRQTALICISTRCGSLRS